MGEDNVKYLERYVFLGDGEFRNEEFETAVKKEAGVLEDILHEHVSSAELIEDRDDSIEENMAYRKLMAKGEDNFEFNYVVSAVGKRGENNSYVLQSVSLIVPEGKHFDLAQDFGDYFGEEAKSLLLTRDGDFVFREHSFLGENIERKIISKRELSEIWAKVLGKG